MSRLDAVHPTLKAKGEELIRLADRAGIKIGITQGLRTIAQQNKLYQQGRNPKYDKNGRRIPVVTNAPGGYSMHNFGLAFDIVVYKADGSYDWNTDSKYRKVGALGKSIGLEWGGDWKFLDLPHFQLSFGLSMAQLRAGKKPPGGFVVGNGTAAAAVVDPNKPYLELNDGGVLKTRIIALQKMLNQAGATPTIAEDGAFGKGTEAAVKQFQTRAGLSSDGIAGPATMTALKQKTTPLPTPAVKPPEKIVITKTEGTEMKEIFYPSKSILESSARVLNRLSNKEVHGDLAISPTWREKLLKGEMTVEEMVAIYGVAFDRGLFIGSDTAEDSAVVAEIAATVDKPAE